MDFVSDKHARSGVNNIVDFQLYDDVVLADICFTHVLEYEFIIRISYDLNTIDPIIVTVDVDASFAIEIVDQTRQRVM